MIKKRICLLDTCIGNFGNKDFYNLQDVGLAKSMSCFFSEIIIYRLLSVSEKSSVEKINDKITLYFFPSKKIGSNGFPNLSFFDSNIDVLIYFSDTQLFFPKIYLWCKKNNIVLVPYIGVTKSNSHNLFIKALINLFYLINLSIYKKLVCLAKTPSVFNTLKISGVSRVHLAPVGLDIDLQKNDYDEYSLSDLKSEFGFRDKDKIILYVGRLCHEKKPLEMLSYFYKIHKLDEKYRLFMIGSGELLERVRDKIKELSLDNYVKIIEKIPNKKMWKLYRISECFVNLNSHEIYGMAILEALFYDCKVVAWSAPGPDYIIQDGVSGWIVNCEQDLIDRILSTTKFKTNDYVLKSFTWNFTAEVICNLLKG